MLEVVAHCGHILCVGWLLFTLGRPVILAPLSIKVELLPSAFQYKSRGPNFESVAKNYVISFALFFMSLICSYRY